PVVKMLHTMPTAWGTRRSPCCQRRTCLGVTLNSLAARRWLTPSASSVVQNSAAAKLLTCIWRQNAIKGLPGAGSTRRRANYVHGVAAHERSYCEHIMVAIRSARLGAADSRLRPTQVYGRTNRAQTRRKQEYCHFFRSVCA